MIIQTTGRIELSITEITFVPAPVPSVTSRPGFALPPFEQVVSDKAVAILLAEETVDVFSVEAWSSLAIPSFEMMGYAAGGGEVPFAEGTGDFCGLMGAGIEMLCPSKVINPSV